MQLGNITAEDRRTFRAVQSYSRKLHPFQFKDRFHQEIRYEVSYDTVTFERDVYSALDVLRDVGGLSSSLISLFTVIVLVLTYNRDRLQYASQLFSR